MTRARNTHDDGRLFGYDGQNMWVEQTLDDQVTHHIGPIRHGQVRVVCRCGYASPMCDTTGQLHDWRADHLAGR